MALSHFEVALEFPFEARRFPSEAPCVIGDTKYVLPTSFHVTSAFASLGVEGSPLPFGDERWHYRNRAIESGHRMEEFSSARKTAMSN
jgi:hypothetical protein